MEGNEAWWRMVRTRIQWCSAHEALMAGSARPIRAQAIIIQVRIFFRVFFFFLGG
jgi:hypothetical protein